MSQKHRKIRICGETAIIPLTQGREAVCDAADAHLADGGNWCAVIRRRRDGTIRTIYASRRIGGKIAYLHRVIVGEAFEEIDHKDGDGLNNRRENLRVATRAQNGRNARTRTDNSSGAKGVSFYKAYGLWSAYITANGRRRSLGYFQTKEEAAEAYMEAAKRLHGEFANPG